MDAVNMEVFSGSGDCSVKVSGWLHVHVHVCGNWGPTECTFFHVLFMSYITTQY